MKKISVSKKCFKRSEQITAILYPYEIQHDLKGFFTTVVLVSL